MVLLTFDFAPLVLVITGKHFVLLALCLHLPVYAPVLSDFLLYRTAYSRYPGRGLHFLVHYRGYALFCSLLAVFSFPWVRFNGWNWAPFNVKLLIPGSICWDLRGNTSVFPWF